MKLEFLIVQLLVGLVVIGLSSLWGFIKRKFNLGFNLDQIDLEAADQRDEEETGKTSSPKVVFGQSRLPEEIPQESTDVVEEVSLGSLFYSSTPNAEFDRHDGATGGGGGDDDVDRITVLPTARGLHQGSRLSHHHDPATLLRDAWVLEAVLHRRGRSPLGRVPSLTRRDGTR